MIEKQKVTIFHNPVTDDSPEDEKEVVSAAMEISNAISCLGLESVTRPFFMRPDEMLGMIKDDKPLCVFNLVESVMGSSRLSYLAPAMFEHWGIPFTGSTSESIMITTNKVLTKKMLLARGVCTAPWIVPGEKPFMRLPFPDRYIIKPVFEDASVGLDSEAVISAVNMEDLEDRTRLRTEMINKPCFAERFIEGREFNISIMDTPNGIKVMPPAEMHFFYTDGMLNIMDYKAKWAEDTPAYDLTKRSFNLEGEDELVETLKKMTLKCWKIFGLKGYARIDFRVDNADKPWVLEINANPCLQPESGLAAAAQEMGLSYAQTIGQIINAACH